MKMLCIRGRQHRVHTGIRAGEVYEVDITKLCCRPAAYASGSVFKKRVLLICTCGMKKPTPAGTPVPWGPDRFIPFDPATTIWKMARVAPAPRRSKPREIIYGGNRPRHKEPVDA